MTTATTSSSPSFISTFDSYVSPYVGVIGGAALAYSWFGQDLVSLAIGGGVGYLVYPSVNSAVASATASLPYSAYYLSAATGAAAAYGPLSPYRGDPMWAVGGAAIGAGAHYLLSM